MLNSRAMLVLSLCAITTARAEQKPLWEFGFGAGAVSFPDYRGADEGRIYPVPFPYFVYRGKIFKADRDGLRGAFFNNESIELNFSVSASVPVDSDDSAARTGMRDLKTMVEIGPSLEVHLWKSSDSRHEMDLFLPIRTPITLESSPRQTGWVFMPRVGYTLRDIGGENGWRLGFGVGAALADQTFHDYFYSVPARYASSERPAYRAGSGYSGAQAIASLFKRFPRYVVGAFLRYDNLSGASFESSPLYRTEHYLAGGIAVAWMITESSKKIESD